MDWQIFDQLLEDELAAANTLSVLYIQDPELRSGHLPGTQSSARVSVLEWRDDPAALLAHQGRFDLGIVCVSRQHPAAVLRPLLARLRDVHCPRVLLLLCGPPSPASLDHQQLLALGFQPHARTRELDPRNSVYSFDIQTYKRTPQWLNPERWANPELWNKHRW